MRFQERSTKKLVMSSASLLLLLVLGTLFFLCNEQWTSEEAFYWTVVTMTVRSGWFEHLI
jgi:hypothetical protein